MDTGVGGLAELRRARGLTQDELASHLGLSGRGSMSAIETGKERPSLELALKIQAWSDGQVSAAAMRPDLADLIASAFRS